MAWAQTLPNGDASFSVSQHLNHLQHQRRLRRGAAIHDISTHREFGAPPHVLAAMLEPLVLEDNAGARDGVDVELADLVFGVYAVEARGPALEVRGAAEVEVHGEERHLVAARRRVAAVDVWPEVHARRVAQEAQALVEARQLPRAVAPPRLVAGDLRLVDQVHDVRRQVRPDARQQRRRQRLLVPQHAVTQAHVGAQHCKPWESVTDHFKVGSWLS